MSDQNGKIKHRNQKGAPILGEFKSYLNNFFNKAYCLFYFISKESDKNEMDTTELNFLNSVSSQRIYMPNDSSFNENSLNASHDSRNLDLIKNVI